MNKEKEREYAIKKLQEFRKDAAEAAMRLAYPYFACINIDEHTNRDGFAFHYNVSIFTHETESGEYAEQIAYFNENWYEWRDGSENLNNLVMCLCRFEAAVKDYTKETKKETAA